MRYACFALMFLLTACFRDGLEECPPDSEYYSYIKFVYDYNMAFEDLFHRQVPKVDVYLFDSDGIFMQKLVDQAPEGKTFSKTYVMGLPEKYKDVAQFVVFAGQYDDQTRVTEMRPGESNLDDLQVSLSVTRSAALNTVDYSLEPLWYGSLDLPQTRTTIERNDTTIIPLVKNTNTIRIALQSLEDDVDLDVNDFSFSFKAINQTYNAYNLTTGTDYWNYTPHFTDNNTDANGTIAVAELHTMRLFSEKDNRLNITNKTDNSTLLDINLNTYINAIKFQQYNTMPLQEYMDREDEYGIILFIKKESVSGRWIVGRITLNSWIVRNEIVGID